MKLRLMGMAAAGGLFIPLFLRILLAQEPAALPVYTLRDCLDIAHRGSPLIQEALQEIEIAGGKKLQALSDALPHLEAEAGYTYLDSIDYFEGGIPLNQHDNYSVGLKLEQYIYRGGRIIAGIKAASFYSDYSEVTLEDARERVKYTVKEFYYLLLLSQDVVRVREDTVKHMQAYLETTGEKYEKGSVSEFEVITARVKLANSHPPLIDAQNRVEILKTALAREMGIQGQDFLVEGELTYIPFTLDLDELKQAGREYRALLRKVRLNQEMLEQNLNAAAAGYQPDLSIFASYEGDRPQMGYPPEDKFEFGWQAGATLRWSLFDGLMTAGRVKEARGQIEQARIKTEDTDRVVQLEIKQSYLNLKSALRALQSQEEVVNQAEKAYQIAKIRWENGISTYLELTDAELDLSEARINRLEALAKYRIALAEVERAVGLTIEELENLIFSAPIKNSGGAEKIRVCKHWNNIKFYC